MLDHGVLVVGYGTSKGGVDYWKLKNSWGSVWGMDGYMLLAAGRDICGVADAAAYPTGVKQANGARPSPTPPGPKPPPPSSNKWISIDEKNCTDAACSTCVNHGSFDTGKCLETTDAGLYIQGSCTADGTAISQLTFSDPNCKRQTGSYPSKTGTCLRKASGGGYTLYTCGTAPAPPSPGPSPGSCGAAYPDCVGNTDQESCGEGPKCHWCALGSFCSNEVCP